MLLWRVPLKSRLTDPKKLTDPQSSMDFRNPTSPEYCQIKNVKASSGADCVNRTLRTFPRLILGRPPQADSIPSRIN